MSGNRFVVIFSLFLLLILFLNTDVISSLGPAPKDNKISYRTSFGQCPSRAAGTLTLQLVKVFESTFSLKAVKEKLLKDHLIEKHFIANYQINYDPLKRSLKFNFNCPEPLMKVQIYKNKGLESYDAILVANGKLYDPTYEVLLKNEKKLTYDLPYLAIPVGEMDNASQREIARLVSGVKLDFRKKISEIILNEEGHLTIILSLKGYPSSVFIGQGDWEEKVVKLQKIVSYMELKKKIPAIINLTNSKKVVVKFNDKI